MRPGQRTSTREMTLRYVFALSVVAGLTLANHLALRGELRASTASAEIVNISARQRMLLQRTALLAQELAVAASEPDRNRLRSQLEEAIAPLADTHHRLIGQDGHGTKTAPQDVQRIYFDTPWLLDTEMRNYLAQLRSIHDSDDKTLHLDDPQVRYVRDVAVSRRMAEALDAVVAAYQSRSDAQTAQLRLLAQWILASTLSVLLAIGAFLFRPMVNRVRADMVALNRLNDSLEQRVAERTATAEQRAQALAESEALYHSLVDHLPMCVVRKDFAGRFVFANDRFSSLVGKPLDQILGRTDHDVHAPDLAAASAADDEKVQRSGEVLDKIERHQTGGDRPMFVQVIKSPVRDADGNVTGTQTIFWDVTERELAEQERREMHVVLENAVEGIARLDEQHRFQTANRTLADMLGAAPEELSGESWERLIHPDDRPRARRLAQQLQTRTRASTEARLLRRDGADFPAELLLVSAPAGHARSVGHVCFVKDISERKSAEQKLLQSERLAAIGQMVAGVAHESRNALQQIQACSQMLKWQLNGGDESVALVDDIEQAEDRLLRLFDDLRGYASPLKLERRPEDVKAVLRRTWEALRSCCHDREAQLILVDGGEWRCDVDAFQLDQVFRNLLENSLAACNDPVRITAACDNVTLSSDDALRITLRDNGPGLPPEVSSRLFEPFFTTKTRGTGLGMVICKRIVEAHGGLIACTAPPEPGAQFTITLPRRSTCTTRYGS